MIWLRVLDYLLPVVLVLKNVYVLKTYLFTIVKLSLEYLVVKLLQAGRPRSRIATHCLVDVFVETVHYLEVEVLTKQVVASKD